MTLHLSAKQAKDGAGGTITGGIQMNDESGTGAGPLDVVHLVIDSTQHEILGTTADSAQTDPTQTASILAILKGLLSKFITGLTIGASENAIGTVGGHTIVASASITRTTSTSPGYTSNEIIANSATATSVTSMQFTVARINAGTGVLRRCRMSKTSNVTTSATFRLHLYTSDPCAGSPLGTPHADGGTFQSTTSGYIGSFDLDASGNNGRTFTDSVVANGVPSIGVDMAFQCNSGSKLVYGLLECRAAGGVNYTMTSGEVFTFTLEGFAD